MPMPRLPETHHRNMRHEKRLPGEEEQGRDRADVKQRHESGGDPIDFVIGGGFAI